MQYLKVSVVLNSMDKKLTYTLASMFNLSTEKYGGYNSITSCLRFAS